MTRRPNRSLRDLRITDPGSGGTDGDNQLVVIVSGKFWDFTPMSEKQIALRLAQYTNVLYVDPPASVFSHRRNAFIKTRLNEARLKSVAPRIWELSSLVLPGPQRPGMAKVTSALVRRNISRAVKELDLSVNALVHTLPLLDLFGCAGEQRKIYWCTDDFVAGAELMGHERSRVERAEKSQVAQADAILAVSPTIADRFSTHRSVHVQPGGCDSSAFSDTPHAAIPQDAGPEPRVGFFGRLSERVDLNVLEAVAEAGHNLLIVARRDAGWETERVDALVSQPNVTYVGSKPFDEMPNYMASITVGLVPYTQSEFNRGSFPLKALEYLAAGRRVISTNLPAVGWLNTELIQTADDGKQTAVAVADALSTPLTQSEISLRQAFARDHDWDVRAKAFAQHCGLGEKINSSRPQHAN